MAMEQLVAQMALAWNAGDANAFAKFFQSDGIFTNVNGSTFKGRESFEQRHREIFSGPLKGSKTAMTIRESRLLRPDVAAINVDCTTTVEGGAPLESRLLLVLTKESGQWGIGGAGDSFSQMKDQTLNNVPCGRAVNRVIIVMRYRAAQHWR